MLEGKAIVYKDIEGYEGFYQIINCGKIWSIDRTVKDNNRDFYRTLKGKELSQCKSSNGYLDVKLLKDGIQNTFTSHRLVAEHFVSNPDNKPCVNHKDGNKENNYYLNLEWVTHSENTKHAYENGLKKPITKRKGKTIECYDSVGTLLKTYSSAVEAAKELDLSEKGVARVARGERKHHGGYVFKYKKQ